MTHITNIGPEEFKLCRRIGCDDRGIYKLKIILVNRWAYFCANHKKELEECGLIVSDTNHRAQEVYNE